MPPRSRRTTLLIILLIAASAVLYLVGNGSVALWDRDEPRYAQTSRQMLESGDWVVPRLLDRVRTAKPILIYWCQATAMAVFGDTVFAARLPSAVAMVLTLIILAVVIARTLGPHRALWTVFIFATSALVIAAAKMCITDSVLLLWIVIAQICLVALYVHHVLRTPATPLIRLTPFIMWIAVAFAGLTKGPVVLGVLGMTLIALATLDVGRNWRSARAWLDSVRWWRTLRPISGIVIVALICGPWLYLLHQREPTFLPQTIRHDVLERAATPLEGHRGPPGFYLVTIFATYFPWSLLLPATIVWAWKRRGSAVIRIALAAVVGPWLMFEIVQTKLVHYVLPVFPFLALLTADLLIRGAARPAGALRSRAFLAAVRGWAIVVVLVGFLPWLALRHFQVPAAAIVAMVILTILAVAYRWTVLRCFAASRPLHGAAALGGGMMLVVAVAYGLYFPHATFLQISPQIAAVLRDLGAVGPGDAVMIDYTELSLAFYQGGTICPEADRLYLVRTPPDAWPPFIVLTDRVWQTAPASIRAHFEELARIRGLWYPQGGRVTEVMVARRRGSALSD